MLSTQKGTLNNGLGNISTWYLEGKIYDAPIEDAEYWIKKGLAVAVVDEVVCENKKYIPKQNKENEDTVKVSKQYGKKGKIR